MRPPGDQNLADLDRFSAAADDRRIYGGTTGGQTVTAAVTGVG